MFPGIVGTPAFFMVSLAEALSPMASIISGLAPSELDVVFGANAREIGVLREESISRMDRIRIGYFRSGDDSRDVQIGLGALGRSDANSFISKPNVQAVGISSRVNSDCFNAHFLTSPNHAECNFPAIGNQYFLEHGCSRLRRIDQKQWSGRILQELIVDKNLDNFTGHFGFDFVEELHGFNTQSTSPTLMDCPTSTKASLSGADRR